MSADDIYAKPVSLDDLLQFKALSPLSSDAQNNLAKIERLDIARLNGALVLANSSKVTAPDPDSIEGKLLRVLDRYGPTRSGDNVIVFAFREE